MEPVVTVEHLKKCYGDFVAIDDVTFTVEIRVGEALEFFSSLSPSGPPWRTVMQAWGLADKRSSTFSSLSGGQQQRLFVALALVNAPQLVFLDEMTTGLDPTARRTAWDLIRRIREQGTTVVLVTHFMDEAEELCDRLAIVHDRRVVALDTPARLAALHAPPPTVTFTLDDPVTEVQYLSDVAGVEAVVRTGCQVSVSGHGALLAHVAAALVDHGIAPFDLGVRRGTLEGAFFALTASTATDNQTDDSDQG